MGEFAVRVRYVWVGNEEAEFCRWRMWRTVCSHRKWSVQRHRCVGTHVWGLMRAAVQQEEGRAGGRC